MEFEIRLLSHIGFQAIVDNGMHTDRAYVNFQGTLFWDAESNVFYMTASNTNTTSHITFAAENVTDANYGPNSVLLITVRA